ncbi:unnamed protein product [Porites lobata]|uniref:Uncharacterized protein n=1 Tax=Porites lobata TaxID=104759 RepID=A0ABN8RME9_9CNID|nr:unnamed protein product [Porites lobata]
MTDQSPQGLKPDEKAKDDSTKEPRTVMDPSLQNSQDHLRERKLPDEKATFVQRLLKMNTYEDDDDIYSVIWDFGVQSVYYDTRPIFLTRKKTLAVAKQISTFLIFGCHRSILRLVQILTTGKLCYQKCYLRCSWCVRMLTSPTVLMWTLEVSTAKYIAP